MPEPEGNSVVEHVHADRYQQVSAPGLEVAQEEAGKQRRQPIDPEPAARDVEQGDLGLEPFAMVRLLYPDGRQVLEIKTCQTFNLCDAAFACRQSRF